MVEISLERPAPRCREPILRLRHPSLERFRARDVLGFLQLARVDAQVSVGRVHQLLQVAEAQRVVDRKSADDAEPEALVYETIELVRPFRGRLAHGRSFYRVL